MRGNWQNENKDIFHGGGGDDAILPKKGPVTRAMSKRLQEDRARADKEGLRVLMNLRIDV